LRVRLDENLSYRVAGAIRAILSGRTGLIVDWVRDEHPPCTTDPSWISKFATDDSAPDRLLRGRITRLEKLADLHGMRFDDLFREERAAAGPPARACARQGKAHSGPKEPDQHHLDRLERVARLAEVGVGVKRVTATDNHFVVTSAVAASLLIGANRHSSWREGIHSLHVGI
jgi:hypothetical protein